MKYKKLEGLYSVYHKQFATDTYLSGHTLVEASSEQDAMDKLNKYLAISPDGAYTDKPCESVKHVSKTTVLS